MPHDPLPRLMAALQAARMTRTLLAELPAHGVPEHMVKHSLGALDDALDDAAGDIEGAILKLCDMRVSQ